MGSCRPAIHPTMTRDRPTKDDDERPSKTQLKREMLELQALGDSLIEMNDSEIAELPLPDQLLAAVRDAKLMTKRGALHRQKQYIGKLMRTFDATPIREALAQRQIRARAAKLRFHMVETWRDQLIREGDTALARLVDQKPAADRQRIRQLIRTAAAELKRGAPPRAARQLFRYIDELMQ